jgi:hypothetical protein
MEKLNLFLKTPPSPPPNKFPSPNLNENYDAGDMSLKQEK